MLSLSVVFPRLPGSYVAQDSLNSTWLRITLNFWSFYLGSQMLGFQVYCRIFTLGSLVLDGQLGSSCTLGKPIASWATPPVIGTSLKCTSIRVNPIVLSHSSSPLCQVVPCNFHDPVSERWLSADSMLPLGEVQGQVLSSLPWWQFCKLINI